MKDEERLLLHLHRPIKKALEVSRAGHFNETDAETTLD